MVITATLSTVMVLVSAVDTSVMSGDKEVELSPHFEVDYDANSRSA